MPLEPGTIALLVTGAVLAGGIAAGASGRIVVFPDLGDLLTTFAIVVSAFFVIVLLDGSDPDGVRGHMMKAAVVLAFGALCYRSYQQNRSIPATALAVATKIPFALAAPLLVLQVAAPSGSTASDRARNRASALLLLTVLAPLLYLVVRDKNGVRRYLGME